MGEVKTSTLPVVEHFTILIFPFRHVLVGKNKEDRLRGLANHWQPWWCRLNQEQVKQVVDDSYFFLPYIRELLFPETKNLLIPGAPDGANSIDRLLALDSPQALAEIIGKEEVLHLTYNERRLDKLRPSRLEYQRVDENRNVAEQWAADFELCWIDVILFPQQVGILLLKVRLPTDHLTLKTLNDFLYYTRNVHPPKLGYVTADWICGPPGTKPKKAHDLLDELLLGLTDVVEETPVSPSASSAQWSIKFPSYTNTSPGQVYGQSFNLYTYACIGDNLSIPNVLSNNQSTLVTDPNILSNADTIGAESATDGGFTTLAERVLYELATATDTSDSDWMPHSSYLAHLMRENRIALWENWQAMALQDNVVFLSLRPNGFARRNLEHNTENDYFYLYLLTRYQKMRLTLFGGELLRSTNRLYHNLRDARRLWSEFIMFRNHYWFVEVTRGFQGGELYQHFQRALNSLALYDEISGEVTQLQDYYERQAQRQTNLTLSVLTVLSFVLLPTSILATIVSGSLAKEVTWSQLKVASVIIYGSMIAVILVWILWWVWRQKRRE